MKWELKESKFKYNGKSVVRRKKICNTPLGQFKVYESVGGRVFVVYPYVQREGFPGYNSDPFNEFTTPKILVKSLEEGVLKCEAKWEQVKNVINNV